MLLDRYAKADLFCKMNFNEVTTTAGVAAYRGDLVLVEGEIGDAQGRRKPPAEVFKQGVLLAEGDQLALASGLIDDIKQLSIFLDKFKADFKPGVRLLVFVVNIPDPLTVEWNGFVLYLVPLQDGMVWNELGDLLGLDKDDFKGMSAADKVLKVRDAFAGFKPKFACASMDQALASRNDAKREARGPI